MLIVPSTQGLRFLYKSFPLHLQKCTSIWLILQIITIFLQCLFSQLSLGNLLLEDHITLLFSLTLHVDDYYSIIIRSPSGYKFIMITITNLTLALTHPNTIYITNKELKLAAGICTYVTKNTGKLLSQGNIKWDDCIVLPFHPTINFEIATKHQYGYNPEELEAVIQGSLNLSEKNLSKDVKTVMANVTNLQGEKVGFLKVDVRSTNKRGPSIFNSSQTITQSPKNVKKQSTLNLQTRMLSPQPSLNAQQFLRITSIIAHIDDIKGKKVHVIFKSGANTLKTEEYTSKAGELVYICNYELKKDKNSNQITAQIHEDALGQTSMLSKTSYSIDQSGKVSKKGELSDKTGKTVGEMFLDCKIRNKNDRKRELNSLLENHLQTSYINNDYSLNQALRSSSVAKKKISIMNSNNQIRFSKEKRFFDMLEDKKSDYVSYQSGGTFEFKELKTDHYYKGASIGRGSKVDFIKATRKNPGVGQYRLPSIWDRY